MHLSIRDNVNRDEWDQLVTNLPGSHILQSWEWGKIKQAFGWTPIYLVWRDDNGSTAAAAMLLERKAGFSLPGLNANILYIPRGPLLDWQNLELRQKVILDLEHFTKNRKAIFLKIDPDLPVGYGIPGTEDASEDPSIQSFANSMSTEGWIFSSDQVQFKNSIWLDLTKSEQELLADMKQKTRYNIRLAERKGISIRQGDGGDLGLLYDLYRKTAVRDNFVIRSREYYSLTWKTLLDNNRALIFIAEYEGTPVGAIIIFVFAGTAWYFYGMSDHSHREKMPNHLLQWEAIRVSRAMGCSRYDFWGAPDNFEESDSMWGVYKFKEGFSGKIVRTIGAWDYPARPIWYSIYTKVIPKVLETMRSNRRNNLQQEQSKKDLD